MAILSPLLMWLALFALAALNGAVREFALAPWLGEAARPVSGLMLIALLAVVIWLYLRRRPLTFRAAALTGGLWFVLTLAAETLLAMRGGGLGDAVREVLATFSLGVLRHGELFALAVVAVGLMPMLVASSRR
ncbi:MAG: hypothetical protein EPO23_13050 [Xanthobacteraceae bacterium]|nr:MAG: hypothetical protein EPO23_13050 [Xanthobacteraceae bacterium]